mmetsp:Transcript_145761/g.254326  ORF Transcript_145761/g.254326 Transcript_145761/m.254326 type:complete len:455 (-) Transcript_145761:122-1486(-)
MATRETNGAGSSQITLGELGKHIGTRWFHARLIVGVALAQMVPSSIIAPVPYILHDITKEYHVSDSQAALVSSAVVFTSIFGVFLMGWASDLLGRHVMLLGCAITGGCLVTMHLFVGHSFWTLVCLRLALGFPFSGMVTLLVPYVIEFFADSDRGGATAIVHLGWPIASVYCIYVVRLLGSNWRLCLASGVFPCIVAVIALVSLPESPRWLLVTGREKEGHRVLTQIFSSANVIGSCHVGVPPAISVPRARDVSPMELSMQLFNRTMRYTTIISSLLYFCTAGFSYALWVWGPEILKRATGVHDVDLRVFMVSEIFGALSTGFVMASVDKMGRRMNLLLAYTGNVLVLLLLACRPRVTFAVVLWQYLSISTSVIWVTQSIYLAEVFPTLLRGTGNGFSAVFGRAAAAGTPIVFALLLEQSLTLALYAVISLCLGGVMCVVLLGRETAQKEMADA